MDKKRFYVYGIYEPVDSNPLDKCFYIGKGTGNRIESTVESKNKNTYKHNFINLLRDKGKEPYSRKLVENVTEKKALELEKRLIKEIGIDNLTNVTEGGDGFLSGEQNAAKKKEVREKISDAMTGKPVSDKHKKSISDTLKGRDVVPKESREKMAEKLRGRNRPDYVGEKISEGLKGNKLSEEHKQKLSEAHSGKELSEEHAKSIQESLPKNHNHPNCPLNPQDAKEIKWILKNTPKTQYDVADDYDVCQRTISKISQNITFEDYESEKPKDYDTVYRFC